MKERAITVRLADELYRKFSAIVAWNGTTIAAVVRKSINEYIVQNAPSASDFCTKGADDV